MLKNRGREKVRKLCTIVDRVKVQKDGRFCSTAEPRLQGSSACMAVTRKQEPTGRLPYELREYGEASSQKLEAEVDTRMSTRISNL